jgi:hypothetical protein
MNEQEKYWEFLKQIRFELYFIDEYIRSTNKPETAVNVITAIASSGSIASWVIWRDLGFVWGIIIAASQLINAVRPLLPYTRRLKLLQSVHGELAKLSLEVEYNWYGISHGDLTQREIHSKLFELKRKREDIDSRHLANHVLPKKPKLEALANTSVDQYLIRNYIGGQE